MRFIRCENQNDILLIERRGDDAREWELLIEDLTGITSPCGHDHKILFVRDARFTDGTDVEQGRRQTKWESSEGDKVG